MLDLHILYVNNDEQAGPALYESQLVVSSHNRCIRANNWLISVELQLSSIFCTLFDCLIRSLSKGFCRSRCLQHSTHYPPSTFRSPTNPRKAAHHHQGPPLFLVYGRTPSQRFSPTNSIMLTTIQEIVITFPCTVTHHLQDDQLDLELVNLVVSLPQLESPSVALPAKLVPPLFPPKFAPPHDGLHLRMKDSKLTLITNWLPFQKPYSLLLIIIMI